ncbi:GNAT family N-acetyltransferase [Pseudomonas anguilliseptica]|uniref:GNAT family N-acetyltransferase n=1 Tax=Pseudomonas anguilliseptica TaxID=53406 RepID=UPI0022B001D7|nr:GNAT family N-acetyltransferase [Pseudomonas anguilliseptica]MCZ4321051.1 GNAT family N-acetyltransferase [Pseudomonas anguilliseptica]
MINISKATQQELSAACLNASFSVTQELQPYFVDGRFGYNIVPVEPYQKSYEDEEGDDKAGDSELFIARVDDKPAGAIELSVAWNGYTRIDNIQVDLSLRRAGVATALLHHAVDWCRARQLVGIMLETQSNNVGACKLYERFGFHLGGFDLHLYGALSSSTEIALFWYWHPET